MVEDVVEVLSVVWDYFHYFVILIIVFQEIQVQNILQIINSKRALPHINRLLLFNLILFAFWVLDRLVNLSASDFLFTFWILCGEDYVRCLLVKEGRAFVVFEDLDLFCSFEGEPFDFLDFAEGKPDVEVVPDCYFWDTMFLAFLLVLHHQRIRLLLKNSTTFLCVLILQLIKHLILEFNLMIT